MNTINPISNNNQYRLPSGKKQQQSLATKATADARRVAGANLASTRVQTDWHIPYTQELSDVLSPDQIQRLKEITTSFMNKILDGTVEIKNLMAPQDTFGNTQEYLMIRDMAKQEVLIPGIPGAVYHITDRENLHKSRAMTTEERESYDKDLNEFGGKYQRALLQYALMMYGHLPQNDPPEHDAANEDIVLDDLHIHPHDYRPSPPDILGASSHPDDLSIVMTKHHLYITLFPDSPHPTKSLKQRLNTNDIDYSGLNYHYDPEYSRFRHASSNMNSKETTAASFIDNLLKDITTSNSEANSKNNLVMILEEIKKQPIAAQIFKNAYESEDSGTVNQKIIRALKDVIEIMNAFFLDKPLKAHELPFYLNHDSLTDHTLIEQSLLLQQLYSAHNDNLREGDFGKELEKYFGIKIIKMPLDEIIPANLMTEFNEKKQAYIQDLFDKETQIDLKNNSYHSYYLNQYQINSFEQGLGFIQKLEPSSLTKTNSYYLTRDLPNLLKNFLKDHVKSSSQMRTFLDETAKISSPDNNWLIKTITNIYQELTDKKELLKEAISDKEIQIVGETFAYVHKDVFKEFSNDFPDKVTIPPNQIEKCKSSFFLSSMQSTNLIPLTTEILIKTNSQEAAIAFIDILQHDKHWKEQDLKQNQEYINKLNSHFNLQ
jgi:hypothetical protein